MLEIKDLHASIDGKEILKGVNLKINPGEIHAIMGPNGSGKSTLSFVLMGHPKYKITKGEILFNGKKLNELSPDTRAKMGMFLGFQYPTEIPGVSLFNFLKTAYNSIHEGNGKVSSMEFREILREKMSTLGVEESFINRYLNEGFSGGEKKRGEILQMAILKPKLALLDEPDSGTDVDALKKIAEGVSKVSKENKMGVILITHYNRILRYIKPDFVHVMVDGKVVKTGNEELANQVDTEGYKIFKEK